MSHLAPLIADLALILICAGVMTLLLKKLKQPLVLGYIVAGFLASPHMPYTPSVVDTANIQLWADIGVIFLLFALGLEFSFKKIMKVGVSAVIAACTIIFCMTFLGMMVGLSFGWKRMDCIFFGGMIAMSSTTIIYKAFEDLGILKKQFANLVLSILILEDILAILLMVMLSTMAVKNNFEGMEMLQSIGKLGFFLVLWFIVGLYLIPVFLKKFRKLMSDETMLIVTLGLCFGMVYIAASTGFSAAFGAFIMGSILSETIDAERIERLVKPAKDLFGAIFFVSVGMMVDPGMILQYISPIIVITLAVILGQALFGTTGVLISGQPLKTAIQCGFSLTQIGEFAFIIASLGISLHVTSDFLYPIVVTVSVITTFLTPYFIKAAEPFSDWADRKMPDTWKLLIEKYTSGTRAVNHDSLWRSLILNLLRITAIYSILTIAVISISFRLITPLCMSYLPKPWGAITAAVITLISAAPFLRAIMIKKNHSKEFTTLWNENHANRLPLVATIVLRFLLAIGIIMFIMAHLFKLSVGLMLGLAIIFVVFIVFSRHMKRQSIRIEQTFLQNLRSRDQRAEYLGQKSPTYAGRLLSKDLHLADFVIPSESNWSGKTLQELNFGKTYGIHVVSILRGSLRINIPGGSNRIFPMDKIQVIASDEALTRFNQALSTMVQIPDAQAYEQGEMSLKQLLLTATSHFCQKSIKESSIREQYRCFVIGIEHEDHSLRAAHPNDILQDGDVLWVVGEKKDVLLLAEQM
ncbi:MAG: cation:proton antiporter [Bacteroidales bacterium]|nr:cation:proton antiporter [Bacteroidales bacterium]